MKTISIKNDISPLFRLAMPLVLTGLVQSAVWFFQTSFLAHLGQQILAASALVSWFFGTLVVILFGILNSINILVAHQYGKNDQDSIALIARDGLLLALLLSILSVILFWNMSPIFLLFGQSKETVLLATTYLHALAWGLPANFMMFACLEVIVGIGHARIILIFSMLTVALNIGFSYLFIFGKLGFPALGIAGAGWGMAVSNIIAAIILLVFIGFNKTYSHFFRYVFKLHKPLFLMEMIRVGAPMGFMFCVEVAFFFALALLIGTLGSQLLAANQVVMQYLGLLMSIMFSIAQAITVRMGHLFGAEQKESAEKAAYIGICTAAVLASLAAIIYWVFPSWLISVDFDIHSPNNFAVISDIKKLLVVSAIFQIFEATRIAFFGALRGLKDTKFTLLTSIISFWCIAFPLGYLFAMYLHWGGAGFWWGMVAGAGFSVWLLNKRFKVMMKRTYHSIV